MKCPVDDTVLAISERRGVEIDYCPQCRGVWLDRGELDKLIDRAAEDVPDGDDDERQREQHREQQHQHREYRPSSGHDAGYRKRKKKSFLSEFFEFD